MRCSSIFRDTGVGYSSQRKSDRESTPRQQESAPPQEPASHAVAEVDKELGTVAPDRVTYSRSFAVEHGQEDDAHLVPNGDVAVSEGSSGRSRTVRDTSVGEGSPGRSMASSRSW